MSKLTSQMQPSRCALYARYSPKPTDAVKGAGYTIGSQLDPMRELALREFGCAEPVEFIETDESAATLDRPTLDRLRDAVRERLFDVVIVYSPDRLVRSVVGASILLDEFRRAGVKLVFVSGSYEDSPEGALSYKMQALFGEFEREKFKERARRGRKRKAREGFYTGGVPFGYRYLGRKQMSQGTLEPIASLRPVVERIFREVAEGATDYRVAVNLNHDGVPTALGKRWHRESVSQVVRKTAYYGEVTGKNGVTVKVPPMIDRALWDRAHESQRRKKLGRVGRPSRLYLLTGFLWCAKCGKRFCTKTRRGDRGAYGCGNIDSVTHKRRCSAPSISAALADTAAFEAIRDTVQSTGLLWSRIAEYHGRVTATKPSRKKDAALARIDKARRTLRRMEELLADPDQPLADAKRRMQDARKALAEAETALPADVLELPHRASVAALAREFASARFEDFADRRGLIERVVEKIRYQDGEMEITCALALGAAESGTERENWNRGVRPSSNFPRRISFVINLRVA